MKRIATALVVEDDPYISDLIGFLLEDAGYIVRTANTAARARELLAQQDVDLLILDWMLPDTPGDQLCREIKSRPGQSFLPILMLTARSTLADRVAGLDAGADDYLTKPFHSDELMARVRALLRIRHAELDRLAMITELQRAYEQLGQTQAQLVQASRLSSLGELVAGVAHELNNPLGIILGNAELLPALSDPEDNRSVEQIIAGAKRARRIVQSLVSFARQGKMEEDWYQLGDLVEQVLDLKRADLRNRGITLDLEYAPDLPMIWADGAQIQQVLLNLLLNAEHALSQSAEPRILIRIGRSDIGVAPALIDEPATPSRPHGRMVAIDIGDNGVGIEESVAEKVFQPFVTTKPVGEGTGLGLAISYGIVAQHKGELQFASKPGRGTTFRVTLPIDRPNTPSPPADDELAEDNGSGSILVIDDEPHLVDMLSRLLAHNGWDVSECLGAERALPLVRERTFDVILCDIRMPDMDGILFYSYLQQLDRQMPHLVFMTGDTSNARTDEFLREAALPVLRKPFTSQELFEVLALVRS